MRVNPVVGFHFKLFNDLNGKAWLSFVEGDLTNM